MQHIGCLGELNILVADDLYSVAPGVSKIKEWTIKRGNTSCLKCLASGGLIVDDKTKVATVVCGLPAALLQGEDLELKERPQCRKFVEILSDAAASRTQ